MKAKQINQAKTPSPPSAGNVIPFPSLSQKVSSTGTAFLMTGQKEGSKKMPVADIVQAAAVPQPLLTPVLLDDVKILTAMQLRRKYRREASSHRNMKSRCLKTGGKVASEFEEFRSFLGNVGVMPGPAKFTLDRLNNKNPDYGPGLVRWATPSEQNNNKGDTAILTVGGVSKPLTAWATETGQKANTLRRRRKKCWSDAEVVYGRQSQGKKPTRSPSSIWKTLLATPIEGGIQRIEAIYQRNHWAYGISPRVSESRALWLAVVAKNKLWALWDIHKEHILNSYHYWEDPDDIVIPKLPEVEKQISIWSERFNRASDMFLLETGHYPEVMGPNWFNRNMFPVPER